MIPAISLIIRVVEESVPNLVALLVVLLPMSMLTALMHSQLFGIFDEGFADPFIALTRVVRMLTSPPPPEATEGVDGDSSPVGSELMYYWGTVVMRLCFGSFVVAILVGAFNKVGQQFINERKITERNTTLPAGYKSLNAPSAILRVKSLLEYIVTGELFQSSVPRLRRQVEDKISQIETCGDDSAQAKALESQLMIDVIEAETLMGPRAVARLIERYGAKRVQTAEDSMAA